MEPSRQSPKPSGRKQAIVDHLEEERGQSMRFRSNNDIQIVVSGCQLDPIAELVHGTFQLDCTNHLRVCFKKDDPSGDAPVMLYYWDGHDCAERKGWWLVHDGEGLAHHTSSGQMPPSCGWHVPHGGPVDETLKLQVKLPGDKRKDDKVEAARTRAPGALWKQAFEARKLRRDLASQKRLHEESKHQLMVKRRRLVHKKQQLAIATSDAQRLHSQVETLRDQLDSNESELRAKSVMLGAASLEARRLQAQFNIANTGWELTKNMMQEQLRCKQADLLAKDLQVQDQCDRVQVLLAALARKDRLLAELREKDYCGQSQVTIRRKSDRNFVREEANRQISATRQKKRKQGGRQPKKVTAKKSTRGWKKTNATTKKERQSIKSKHPTDGSRGATPSFEGASPKQKRKAHAASSPAPAKKRPARSER